MMIIHRYVRFNRSEPPQIKNDIFTIELIDVPNGKGLNVTPGGVILTKILFGVSKAMFTLIDDRLLSCDDL